MYRDPARLHLSFECDSGEIPALDVREEPSSETIHPLPPPYVDGELRIYAISDDIRLFTVRHGPAAQSIRVDGRNRPGTIEIAFVLDARQCTVLLPGTRIMHMAAANTLLICSPSAMPVTIDAANQALHFVNLSVSPALIRSLMEDGGEASDPTLLSVVNEPYGEPSLLQSVLDLSIRPLMASLENPPYRGSLGRLFREARAYEMLAGTLYGFNRAGDAPPSRSLSRRDRERMEEARGIIDSRPAAAPPLSELARSLGISVAKLKRDFKRIHGLNVHEYVITRRMDQAATLLAAGELSVKEAAFAVGYRSTEGFSQAFRRHYGRSPGSFTMHRGSPGAGHSPPDRI
jgi:AraC-like DNA-binding protein